MTRDNQQKTLKSKPVKPKVGSMMDNLIAVYKDTTIMDNMDEIMRLVNENRQLKKRRISDGK